MSRMTPVPNERTFPNTNQGTMAFRTSQWHQCSFLQNMHTRIFVLARYLDFSLYSLSLLNRKQGPYFNRLLAQLNQQSSQSRQGDRIVNRYVVSYTFRHTGIERFLGFLNDTDSTEPFDRPHARGAI